jgi:hypothetical protein
VLATVRSGRSSCTLIAARNSYSTSRRNT